MQSLKIYESHIPTGCEETELVQFVTYDDYLKLLKKKFLEVKELKNTIETIGKEFTCTKCEMNKDCKYAWDQYNTGGDCLAEK